MKAYELIDSPEKWTQKESARNRYGVGVPVGHESACAFCISGAIERAYGAISPADYCRIMELSDSLGNVGLTYWNDDPRRTWKEVYDKLKEFDI